MKKIFLALGITTLLILIGTTSAFCEDRYQAVVHVTKDPGVSGFGTVYLECHNITFSQPYQEGKDTYPFPLAGMIFYYPATATVEIGPYSGSTTHILTPDYLDFYVHVSGDVQVPPGDPEDPEE